MDKSSLVSVIIPVFNVAPYLREAIESVLSQTYDNLEIIIIDDGSTDGSGLICDEYKSDERVIVEHQSNQGLSNARNEGLRLATGEYIAFLDSDDAFHPEMIQIMLEAIKKYNVDLAVCGYESYQTESRMSSVKKCTKKSFNFDNEEILSSQQAQIRLISNTKMSVNVWSKIYRKNLWSDLWFPDGRVYEDVHVMLRLFEICNRIATVPQRLVFHRIRKGSITTTNTIKNIQDRIFSITQVEGYVEAHINEVFPREFIPMMMERHALTMSMCFAKVGLKKNSEEIIQSIRRETIKRWKNIKGNRISIKSKVVCFLFMKTPYLFSLLVLCYQIIKRLLLSYN